MNFKIKTEIFPTPCLLVCLCVCICVCIHMGVCTCVFARVYVGLCVCECMGVCLHGCGGGYVRGYVCACTVYVCMHVYAWMCLHVCMCGCVCMNVFAYALWCTHMCVCMCVCAHSLLTWCHWQGACHSLETHGSLLSITLSLVQNPSELILINLEATSLRHEAVKCECLQMSVKMAGIQEDRSRLSHWKMHASAS